jgi:hypothetical protein
MKRMLVIAAVVGLVAAAASVAATRGGSTQGGFLLLPRAAPAGQMTFYGHIKSLKRSGGNYLLRFDPAWFTSGSTANTAAYEDGVIGMGDVMPNDNYVRDESHKTLLYKVPSNAQVTVLVNKGTSGISATPISVAKLAQIVDGKTVPGLKLFEPLESGIWIRVRIDTVNSIDQQYQP